ncbi:MAG: hypothetical protein WCL32_09065 [Planctomycetota bacterium]
MSREVKIGTAVAGSFLSLVGIVVGTKMYKGDVPKPPEGIAAVVDQVAKDLDGLKPALQQPVAPATLPATFLSEGPLPGQSSGFPAPPPPGSFTPPSFPSAPAVEIDLPKVPDVTKPLVDVSNDLNNKIREQEQAARAAIEKTKNDLINSSNNLIDGTNKKIEGFANDLNDRTKKALNDLPAFPDPAKLTLPPVTLVDNTIVGGGSAKPNPKNDTPAPPSFTGNPTPPAGEIPPVVFGGGSQPPPPPGVTVAPPKNPAPSPFGAETPRPPIDTPMPPVGFPPTPGPGSAPQPPSDFAPTVPPVSNPFGSTPPTPAPPITSPGFDNPPPPASVQPKPATQPQPPITQPAPPPPQPPFGGNPFGTNPGANPVGTPPAPPTPNNSPVPTLPGPPNDSFPPQPAPPMNVAPLVAPAVPTNVPLVKTESPQRYICQGNESFASISARQYGNESFARALEEYNRDLPNAVDSVRAQPARLAPGTPVWLPSQNYLLDRYGRFVSATSSLPPVTPPAPVRPLTQDIGISPPAPLGARPPAVDNAGVTSYRVPAAGMYLSQVAERQLGNPLRWVDIYRLNPGLQPEQPLREGMEIRVPTK